MKKMYRLVFLITVLLGVGCTPDDNDVQPTALHWSKVVLGGYHTLAIRSDGTLWAWGNNEYGQLGDGTTVNKLSPVQIGNDSDWETIGGGQYFSAGLKSDGTIWAWGRNEFGQLGDNTIADSHIPQQVGSGNYLQLVVGNANLFALKNDHTIWGWGANEHGQVGDGNPSEGIMVPIQIGSSNDWSSVFVGQYHCFAKKGNGELWGWGQGIFGQLGTNEYVDQSTPVLISSSSAANWEMLAGGIHTVGLRTDGTLWTSGSNFFGELGNASIAQKLPTFGQVGTDTWLTIDGVIGSSAGIKSDGTLWVWGYNAVGQLGLGDTDSRNVPTQLGTSNNWKSVDIGWSSGVALTTDNVLWSWGYPANIGNGNETGPTTPVVIPCPQ